MKPQVTRLKPCAFAAEGTVSVEVGLCERDEQQERRPIRWSDPVPRVRATATGWTLATTRRALPKCWLTEEPGSGTGRRPLPSSRTPGAARCRGCFRRPQIGSSRYEHTAHAVCSSTEYASTAANAASSAAPDATASAAQSAGRGQSGRWNGHRPISFTEPRNNNLNARRRWSGGGEVIGRSTDRGNSAPVPILERAAKQVVRKRQGSHWQHPPDELRMSAFEVVAHTTADDVTHPRPVPSEAEDSQGAARRLRNKVQSGPLGSGMSAGVGRRLPGPAAGSAFQAYRDGTLRVGHARRGMGEPENRVEDPDEWSSYPVFG